MADDEKWKQLWQNNKLSSCKLKEAKDFLKSVGLPMNGDAVNRVRMYLDVKYLDLVVLQDEKKCTPFELSQPQLRKMVAQLGMDPSGDKDELHSLLINYLKQKNSSKSDNMSHSNDDKATTIAKQILEMKDDYPTILSTSGINITTDSSVATMRKAYLKLSLLIHPDKLQKTFPDATKAFQCLVNAYERMSQPELFIDEEDDKKKKIVRSNDGCHRTQIFCPRCEEEWGLPINGFETYDYNFIMMGLRTYHCAICLFDFGCMTAIHKCPFCRKDFEYHPNDYHRKILCTNKKCGKPFGFFIFNISERREKEYREEIRRKQEQQLKEKEQLEGRSKRAKQREVEIGEKGKEKLFVKNLLDECPRCGEEIEISYELRKDHLTNCNDKKKMAAYAKKLKLDKEIADEKQKLREIQEETQNLQTWDYLGAKTSEMWLLTEKQVQVMCEKYNLDTNGTKDELIARLVQHRNTLNSKRMLTDGSEVGSSASPAKKRKLSLNDLPSNLHSMTVSQLKAVCASHGIVTNETSKKGIIKFIEKQIYKDEPLRITDGKKKK